jgi:hypothetical protein
MAKKLRPAVDLMAFKCSRLKVKTNTVCEILVFGELWWTATLWTWRYRIKQRILYMENVAEKPGKIKLWMHRPTLMGNIKICLKRNKV